MEKEDKDCDFGYDYSSGCRDSLAFVHLLYSTIGIISLTLSSNFCFGPESKFMHPHMGQIKEADKRKINCITEPWKLLKLKAPSDSEDGNVACEWKEKII